MNDIHLTLNHNNVGEFYIRENEIKIAFMTVHISNEILIVFHTEVLPQFRDQNLAKKLLGEMVQYAREHNLKVYPRCPYVHAQFKKHREQYADVWKH